MQATERGGWRSSKTALIPQQTGRKTKQRRRFLLSTRLLLTSCLAVSILVVIGLFFSASISPSRLKIDAESPRRMYTVLINTYKRNDLLKKSVEHYSSCAGVDSIRIVWSEDEGPSEALMALLERTSGGLKFDVNKENSLNNRFKDVEGLTTDAIFSVDDDVLVPCSSLDFAFGLWQSSPSAMVGFVPRVHFRERKSEGKGKSYKYGGWWAVWWTGTYSMVLTKAAFFHRNYLKMYTESMPAAIREYVTKHRNCEDVAMSFLIANETALPPLWVKGPLREIGSAGISSLTGHDERRSQCINDFAAVYGRMPLVSTTMKIVDARHSWLW